MRPSTATARPLVASTAGAGRLTELELRADIESLEQLQQERRVKRALLDRLEALHGAFGLADAYRRQLRGAIATRLREAARETGRRLSNEEAEDAACADADYKRTLDAHLGERIEYLRLKNEVTEIEERIRNRELALLAYNAETRLR